MEGQTINISLSVSIEALEIDNGALVIRLPIKSKDAKPEIKAVQEVSFKDLKEIEIAKSKMSAGKLPKKKTRKLRDNSNSLTDPCPLCGEKLQRQQWHRHFPKYHPEVTVIPPQPAVTWERVKDLPQLTKNYYVHTYKIKRPIESYDEWSLTHHMSHLRPKEEPALEKSWDCRICGHKCTDSTHLGVHIWKEHRLLMPDYEKRVSEMKLAGPTKAIDNYPSILKEKVVREAKA